MIHQLHPLPEGRFYCGPSAVSAFTGIHPKEGIRTQINQLRGRKITQGIIGTNIRELASVLEANGFSTQLLTLNPFSVTISELAARFPKESFIFTTRNHHVAYSAGWCLDSKSKIPRIAHNFPGKQARAKYLLYIYKRGESGRAPRDLYRQAGFEVVSSAPFGKTKLTPWLGSYA